MKKPLENQAVLQGSASGCDYLPECQAPPRGVEPTALTTGKTPLSESGAAECAAVGARDGKIDAALAAVIEAYKRLSEGEQVRFQELIETC